MHRLAVCVVALTTSIARADEQPVPDPQPATAVPTVAPTPGGSPPAVPAQTAFSWQPFGFLRTQYITVQNDPNVSFVGRDDGFEIQNARIGVSGHVGTRAWFVVSIDGAVDERTQVNTP